MKITLVKADGVANNNKFWTAECQDGNAVVCRWGRVGATGQSATFTGGQNYIDKKVVEKKRKGYREVSIVDGNLGVQPTNLLSIAKKEISHMNHKEVESLIERLVQWNAHHIGATSTLKVDLSKGQIALPSNLGVLTTDAIKEARGLLKQIEDGRTTGGGLLLPLINNYLSLVPQVVPRSRGWVENYICTDSYCEKQEELLDALESTLNSLAPSGFSGLFNVSLNLLDSSKERAKVEKLYTSTRQTRHTSFSLSIKSIYEVEVRSMREAYEHCQVNNIKTLWHGTRVGNLLNIIRTGLVIPAHAAHGRLFGPGVYFSDQSTKALNYSAGYWDGRNDSNCFMFLADVKLGRSYTPRGTHENLPKAGFDSTFAEAGKSGVINNEFIVYSLPQINLRYLVEFAR